MADGLFEVAPIERTRKITSLELVLFTACPECGKRLIEKTAEQGVLFRHGGAGATQRITWKVCHDETCRWWMIARVEAGNPRRW